MSIRFVAKKSWPILGIFALVGRRYKIVLTSDGEDFKVSEGLHAHEGMSKFKKEVDGKWGPDTVTITTHDVFGTAIYKAEISPEKVQEILRGMRINQPALTKS